ncbi:MAG: biotin/lipoyl-binding protein [Chloroflexi bacterium]|nr:biotin/lipoyl-binding protein [Chloroflexota bacterium]
MPDPRGVRVGLAPASTVDGVDPIVVEPPEIPVAPVPHVAGRGILGGTALLPVAAALTQESADVVLVDGQPVLAALAWTGGERATLRRPEGPDGAVGSRRLLMLPALAAPSAGRGVVSREVVVEGWRVEVEVEPAARAALRERARRGREEVGHSGPTEVRAIIPGVVVSVSVTPGDPVTAGQQLLVVEAMKMQNELRAPRDGTIERVAVGQGSTIEVGDVLLVIT